MFTVLLFYKYVSIVDPETLRQQQLLLCQQLGLKGRLMIAREGINATLEGSNDSIKAYLRDLLSQPEFSDIHLKQSSGTGDAFPKLVVKVRDEIVSTHLGDQAVDPIRTTARYITAEELHELFLSKEELYIIDMRNDFEQAVGHFENSMLPKLGHFRDLPTILPDLQHLRNKQVITVCTGGIRCEKASGFLIQNGFTNVFQLFGGIVTYMEKYPNQHFKGKLYVFDRREIMGFNTDSPEHEIVGRCEKCGVPSENMINCDLSHCRRYFVCCEGCAAEGKLSTCGIDCGKQSKHGMVATV